MAVPRCRQAAPHALATASRVAALKARCRRAGVPVIYGNDNHGHWRSDLRQVVESSLASEGAGARITALVAPRDDDYFVLKPKHSAFFGTPLDLLLQHLDVRRLLLAGVASDQCVMATAMDARMRDYEVLVVGDCVASQTVARNRRALEHFGCHGHTHHPGIAHSTARSPVIRGPRSADRSVLVRELAEYGAIHQVGENHCSLAVATIAVRRRHDAQRRHPTTWGERAARADQLR